MKNTIRKLILVFSIILSTFLCFVIQTNAADVVSSGKYGENIIWTLDDEGTLTLNGSGAMADCAVSEVPWEHSYVESVVINDGITSIGAWVFSNHRGLTNVTIHSDVTSIGEYAFNGCYLLETIILPDTLVTISDTALGNCPSLSTFVVDVNNPVFSSLDGNLFNKEKTTLIQYARGKTMDTYIVRDTVTQIGASAFYLCENLKTVTLPNGIVAIGDRAFFCCSNLNSINIPDSVTSIGDSAFYCCYALSNISIPDGVTSIGDSAFYSCSSLSSINIPNSVTSIGDSAFYNCNSLSSINLPDGVTSIGDSVFFYCSNLSSINIPDGVTSIGDSAFYSCRRLSSISIPDTVASIGDSAFNYCYKLTDVYYSSSKTHWDEISIGSNNNYLTDATIHFTKIDVESITLDKTSIELSENETFTLVAMVEPLDATNTTVTWSTDNSEVATVDQNGIVTAHMPGTATITATADGKSAVCVVTVTEIVASGTCGENLTWKLDNEGTLTISGSGAMTDWSSPNSIPWKNNASNIKTVIINNDVTTVGANAFYNCNYLTSVTLSEDITTLGMRAFYGCSRLSSIALPDILKTIKSYAFTNCTALTSITLPSKMTTLAEEVFSGCTKLDCIEVDESNPVFSSLDGNLFNKAKTKLILYAPGKTADTYIVPDTVTQIGTSAFYMCKNLKTVTLSDSVTTIENSSFDSCTGLTSISIPDSVKTIGASAFTGCKKLASVSIGKGVTTIGSDIFSGCTKLSCIETDENNPAFSSHDGNLFNKNKTELVQYATGKTENSYCIPVSVTTIGNSAFKNCSSLNNITIPDSVTSIEAYAFAYCSSLNSITIPDSVTSIEAYAFAYCSNLSSIAIPDKVTSIGNNMFASCKALTDITIPDSVTSIGVSAFAGCNALADVYYNGTQKQWSEISINRNNTYLTNATVHFLAVEVTDITITESSESGVASYVVSLNIANLPTDAVIFVASYNSKDTSLEIKKLSTDNLSTEISVTDVKYVKAFVWNSTTVLSPLCEPGYKEI